jgi:hypothetical protein
MAKNVDHHRYTYSGGIKAVEEQKWGRQTAYSRYGVPEFLDGAPQPPDNAGPRAREYAQGRGYHNDVPSDSWLRAAGEDATTKPGFDKDNPWRTQKGGKGK